MQKVTVIRRKNRAVLVQWVNGDGKITRGSIPAEDLHDRDMVDEETLEMAIPAYFPWAELIEITVTPQDIEDNLHRVGIWTLEDLIERPNAAVGAIQAAYKMDMATLRQKALQFKKHHPGG